MRQTHKGALAAKGRTRANVFASVDLLKTRAAIKVAAMASAIEVLSQPRYKPDSSCYPYAQTMSTTNDSKIEHLQILLITLEMHIAQMIVDPAPTKVISRL